MIFLGRFFTGEGPVAEKARSLLGCDGGQKIFTSLLPQTDQVFLHETDLWRAIGVTVENAHSNGCRFRDIKPELSVSRKEAIEKGGPFSLNCLGELTFSHDLVGCYLVPIAGEGKHDVLFVTAFAECDGEQRLQQRLHDSARPLYAYFAYDSYSRGSILETSCGIQLLLLNTSNLVASRSLHWSAEQGFYVEDQTKSLPALCQSVSATTR
jgi:hypothetical protein